MDYSFSNTLSKGSVYESDSIWNAYQNDAESRLADGVRPEAISNEEIHRGDEILETYRVEDDAIHGGMGSVWRVHHNGWDTDLAMKRPQPRFFAEGTEARKADFIAECERWINLGLHPGIVSCYYVREIGGVPTIFSEWMDGGSLKDAIQSGRLYEGREAEIQARILDIAIQTARGLRYSHEQGLIHQDVKPGNILLTKDWDAKVADFGLAKAQSKLIDGVKPVSSGYTLAYCPKEQAEGAEAAIWMDVYAWALTVLEMYLGGHPWQSGAEAAEQVSALLDRCRVAMPEAVRGLLTRCLSAREDGFDGLIAPLLQAYREAAGRGYPRADMDAAEAAANNLNNYAISMMDLGRRESAAMAWDEAVSRFPDHVQSVINRAFFRWHEARITDREVLETLNGLPDSEEKREALDIFAVETGEKEALGGNADTADVMLPYAADGGFESDQRVWLALSDSVDCFDTDTGVPLCRLTSKELGVKLTVLAAARDGSALYTGAADHILCVETAPEHRSQPVALLPEAKDREQRYPAGSREINGERYRMNLRQTKWLQLWLEEDDSVLCVTEESLWERSADLEKYARWARSVDRSPVNKPRISEKKRYHLLRYRLETPTRGALESVLPIEKDQNIDDPFQHTQQCRLLNCKAQGCARPGDRWKSVMLLNNQGAPVSRLQDNLTGRFVRSEHGDSARIITFSPDRRRYLFTRGTGAIGSKGMACLRSVPESGAGYRLYTLSRVKDIGTVRRENEAALGISEAFDRAFGAGDYAGALRQFEAYRALPDCRDSARAIEMELKLDKVCRRVGLNHTAAPSDAAMGFDMSAPEDDWVRIEGGNGHVRFTRGLVSLGGSPLGPARDKALQLVKSSMPIRYANASGTRKELAGDKMAVTMIRRDLSLAFVNVMKWGRGPEQRQGICQVDLNRGKVSVVAEELSAPVPAPDGKVWLGMTNEGVVRVYDGPMTGYTLRESRQSRDSIGDVAFFPDGRFALYQTSAARELGIFCVRPAKTGAEPYDTQWVTLPPLSDPPDGLEYERIAISADGMHIIMRCKEWFGAKEKRNTDVPCLRLSWDYEYVPPEPPKADGASRPASNAAAPVSEAPKKKGFFGRLFGKK